MALIDSNGCLGLTARVKESININGLKYFPLEIEAALEAANLEGLIPFYTVVFAHSPKGEQTEVLCVIYLPIHNLENVLARVRVTNGISTILVTQCGVKPCAIIALELQLLQKSSLGRFSMSNIRAAFEEGLYTTHQKQNNDILQEYRLAQREPPSNDIEAQILVIFSELFDLVDIENGGNTSLSEMGVSSIDTIKLKTRI